MSAATAQPTAQPPADAPQRADALERRVVGLLLVLGWLANLAGFVRMEMMGQPPLISRVIAMVVLVVHPLLGFLLWRRLAPLVLVELMCLLETSGLVLLCVAIRLYFPDLGSWLNLTVLYLWMPVIYVFAFALPRRRWGLYLAIANVLAFLALTAPFLLRNPGEPDSTITIQMHLVSISLVAALYLFSGYVQRLRMAELTMDQLARLARTDDLTRLDNRRHLTEVIDAELARFDRYGHDFSIILIDIDHFKRINDQFGHATGDQCLVAASARLREVLRRVDTLGRWGGEEFIIVLPDTPMAGALTKARKLCEQMASTPLVGPHRLTISAGVGAPRKGEAAHSLLQRVDAALYVAKNAGRNQAAAAEQSG